MNRPQQPTVHLVRHLMPEADPTTWLDRHALAGWLDSERVRGLAEDAAPSGEVIELVTHSRYLLVSPVVRAQATATAILDRLAVNLRPEVTTIEELSEAPLPALPIPRLRLPLAAWGLACRTAWFLGYAGKVEPRQAAVDRANKVARYLGNLAPSGPVTVIAHGIINQLVARELRRLGWAGPRLPNHHHGGTSTYRNHHPTTIRTAAHDAR